MPMRFATRYDRWLVVMLVFAALASCGIFPALRFIAPASRPGPVWLSFVAWPIWGIVLATTLPQYYEVREDGLFIRQGWRRILLPYDSLMELQSVSSSLSAAVYSTQRILIVTRESARILIAVADEDRFLAEVARRAPQLERRPYGLGLPFAPPTVV